MEILILLIKKSSAKPYFLKDDTTIRYDAYADNPTIYLIYLSYDKDQNTAYVREVLNVWKPLKGGLAWKSIVEKLSLLCLELNVVCPLGKQS